MTAPRTAPGAPAPYAPPLAPARAPDARTHDAVLAEAARLLDDALALVRAGAVGAALAHLVPGLRQAYDALPAHAWRAFADACLDHPLAALLHEDPFVYAAFAKLRGYPGDAGILDLIYETVPPPAGTTPLGAALYAHDLDAPACRSVRWRRDHLAAAIDDAAARAPGAARVLSVACGHLREAERSAAVRDGALAAFHALDQDPRSLALVRAEHAPLGVTPVLGSVRDVLTGRVRFAGLTLAYAAGLYDYLPTPVAVRLTARMFDMLAPGGRVLVANFCPGLRDIGFMEAFMDWRLIYREEPEMHEIADAVPAERVARRRLYRDPGHDVVYLELERR